MTAHPLRQVLAWPNNLLTLSRLVVTGIIAIGIFAGLAWPPLPTALVLFVTLWGFDLLDGWVARRLDRASDLGATLDLLVDRVCDALLAGLLILVAPQHALIATLYLALRIAPDGILPRLASPGRGFAAQLREVLPARIRPGPRALDWLIEANSASKAAYFSAALFLGAPAWTGVVLLLPALGFALATGTALQASAAALLSARAATGRG